MHDDSDLAETLADIARQINAPTDLSSTLDAIARSVRDSLPGVDHVGLSMVHRGGRTRIETLVGTDQLVWDLDSVQYELREGPCYDAILHTPVMVADELHYDHRWPATSHVLPRTECEPRRGSGCRSTKRPRAV